MAHVKALEALRQMAGCYAHVDAHVEFFCHRPFMHATGMCPRICFGFVSTSDPAMAPAALYVCAKSPNRMCPARLQILIPRTHRFPSEQCQASLLRAC